MQTKEYRTVDKSEWGRGEWQDEPDKVQWRDEATGLPCLIVRNHGGAWCGYVGISEGHALYGKGYGDCVRPEAHPAGEEVEWHHECTPGGMLSAHGGITFADFCSSHDETDFKQWQERMEQSRAEAAKYPVGDAARRLREWGAVMNDFSAWQEKCQATGICHVPDAGEPERVWWFGFDCSHLGDASPAYDHKYGFGGDSWYKDIAYVKRETTKLAAQLADVARP